MIFLSQSRPRSPEVGARLGPLDVLVLSAWCGLAGGELEVAARVVPRAIGWSQHLYMMTRHFVWLIPLIDLMLFLAVGAALALVTRKWPRRAGWCSPRLIVALAILPALAAAIPGIYVEAWAVLALGFGVRLAPVLERHPAGMRRWLGKTAPALLALVVLQAAWVLGGEPIRRWGEQSRPLPPHGSPDVLLIVLDTLRADRLSVYGYPRETTPTLTRLAKRGIRFDEARATAPWTLASHASFFTGRLPRELGVRWMTPLRGDFTTIAGFLGSRGYATAGFVANAGYCSYDTGLDRGFTHFEDYVLERPGSLRTAGLLDAAVKSFGQVTLPFDRGWLHRIRAAVGGWFFADERKSAAWINRDFLDWFDHRPEPGRPSYVFLNYLDTHTPYVIPPGARHRFGANPRLERRFEQVLDDWSLLNKQRLPRRYWKLASDAYDNCVAYLDEQLGALIAELERRGALDRTLVIITSDHGEGLGEHDLFMHGESLYRTEIRVPLLILPPSRRPAGAVVGRTVSLRDLPATIVDLVGLGGGSPFPGRSLARYWTEPPAGASPLEAEAALSELAGPNPQNPNHGRSPSYRGPLISIADGDLVYIRNQGDGGEELFNERDDPAEAHNLARDASMEPVLRRFRDRLLRDRARAPSIGDAGPAPRVAAAPDLP
jgi:arylsulfatase A-like enzyme